MQRSPKSIARSPDQPSSLLTWFIFLRILQCFLLPLSFQTIRIFLAAWKRYLTLLGFQPMDWMVPVGMFTSLSSELAVAIAPLEYRLAKGLLYQSMTIRELQVRNG